MEKQILETSSFAADGQGVASSQLQSPSLMSEPMPGPGRQSSPAVASQVNERARNALSALRLFAVLLALVLLSRFVITVPAGERGVLLRFGAVQERILAEGLHPILPLVHSVQTLSIRVQSLPLEVMAASRDLQDVNLKVSVSWAIEPDRVNRVFERLGDERRIISTVIEPAM